MTAPNIANLTTITGSIATVALSTTSETLLVNNAASSSTCLKINCIYAANIDATTAYAITVNIHSAASLGGTSYTIANAISIPINSTFTPIVKDIQIYLTENMSIGVQCGTANKINVICSYEILA